MRKQLQIIISRLYYQKEINKLTNNLMFLFYRDITEDGLDVIFGKFGNIVQKNLLKDKMTGMPRGVAFVR
jgi:protein sex-lethal